MPTLYPFRFRPTFRRYLWGGRRLATVLQKPLGEGKDYAESWEVVDRGADQSVVAWGPRAGTTLHELLSEDPSGVLGPARAAQFGADPLARRFPLLLKFLDCHRNLSVQVHPNDDQARCLDPPDLGKTEAWVILDALPGSKVYAGLKPGMDRSALEREVARGTTELCLHTLDVRPGDCIFIPARTVHALGAGLLVAEIQQSSDTTFRLSDWNRVGADGKPRPLHVQAALETIDFQAGPIQRQRPEATERDFVQRLVVCDKFVLDRWQLTTSAERLGGDGRCHLVAVLRGAVRVAGDPATSPLEVGQTMLIPAAAGPTRLTPLEPASLLDIYLP